MPINYPSDLVKAEIVFFLEQLLNYGLRINQSHSIQIEAKWDKENLKIKATLSQLVLLLPNLNPEACASPSGDRVTAKQKSHLGYLLTRILRDRLQILIDERRQNNANKYKGIAEWKFTLKFWYPATEADYIALNLQAFDRHWHHTYQIKTPPEPALVHNLPLRRHSQFIGHQTELNRLLKLLATDREQIIAIEGMAGVGKTTLALEVAYQSLTLGKFTTIIFSSAQSQQLVGSHLARRFIAECNLRDLLQVIFKTLDRSDDRALDIEEQIHAIYELLGDRPTLIIVDNIENLTDQTDTIEFILNLPPTVKVIITSRVRLGIGGVINLEPLPVKESMELIKHQAKNQNLPIESSQIKLIYRNTRGLPLAINYSIGLLSTTGTALPEEPLADTDLALYCFERVINQLRAIPDSIAYQLLLSLSLFTDGAATAALTYITGGNPITPGLQQLDRSCLVWAIAPERYQIHSLTQEYAQLELNQERELAGLLRNRWLNWYLDLVAPYGALDWQDWQDYSPITAEWKNLRLVVDWCIQQDRYLEVLQFWQCLKGFTLLGGRWLQRQRWLEWLQEAAVAREDLPTIAELKYQHSFTLAFIDQSDSNGKAIELALIAWEMRQHLESDRQFELVMYIASLYIRKLPQENTQAVNLELAKMWIDRGLEMVALLPTNHPRYHRHQFQVYYYQAEIQLLTGQLDLAYDNYFQANQYAKKAHWQRFIHYTSGLMAIILTKQGEFIRAERRLITVLKYTGKYGDARAGTLCLKHLAQVKKAKGDLVAARDFAERAKSGFKRLRMNREFKMMEQFLQTLDV